jgi:hypothetical protein
MSNRYDDLRRFVLRKRNDFSAKHKLVKFLRREIHDKIKEAQMKAVTVGFKQNNTIVIIIEADYGNALLIKEALNGNKMLKYFDIQIKPDETFPEGAILNGNKINKNILNENK